MTAAAPRVGDTLTTAEQLDALPDGVIVMLPTSKVPAVRFEDVWFVPGFEEGQPSSGLRLPTTVLYVPGEQPAAGRAETTTATDEDAVEVAYRMAYDVMRYHPGIWHDSLRAAVEALADAGLLATARAETTTATDEDALDSLPYFTFEDDDVAPDEEFVRKADVARLLATARTRPTREQVIDVLREKDPDNHNGWHSPADHYYEAQADAVLALLADQPTEAEAGARALEQAAEAVYTDSVPSLAPWLLTRAARIRAGGA